jgi:hypothetical protein
LGAIGNISGALAQAGQQAGIFSDDTVRALQDVQAVAQDTANLIASIATGNVLGAIGAGINLIGSIGGALGIGQSEEERRREAIDRENVAQLERISRQLGNIRIDVQGDIISRLQTAFDVVTDPARFLLEDNTRLGIRVNRLLETFGLSMDDVIAASEAAGLQFQNTAEFYERFAKEVLPTLELNITRFGDSLAEQTRRADIGARLRGEGTDPQAVFQRQLDVISGFSPAIERAFQGVETDSREAVRAALLRLFEQFDAGQLTAADLGLTKDEFLQFLEDGARFLESFDQGLADATRTLGNIPDTFKVQQAEFFARRTEPLPPVTVQAPTGFDRALPPSGVLPVEVTEPIEVEVPNLENLPARIQEALDRLRVPDPIVTSRPVTDALVALSGGASLRDLVSAITAGGPSFGAAATAPGFGTPGGTGAFTGAFTRPVSIFVASMPVVVQGTADAEATAAAVRRRIDRESQLIIPED